MTTMTPSEVKTTTQGQIDKAVANYRALLEKRAPEFESAAVQTVLGQPEFAEAQFALFRERVESASEIIIRRVKVDRSRSRQKVIDATGRKQYIDKDVLATMPTGEGDKVDVWFVPTKRHIPAAEVPAFLARYGLVPDPRAQAAVNKADPAFADKVPNGTQWGDNCCLAFGRWNDERRVRCDRFDYGWYGDWFLCGVPASRK